MNEKFSTTRRLRQILLILGTFAVSWLMMMAVHELGHVIHAWISGGQVVYVELRPWTISRTDVWPNPRPLFVVWGGPIWGCVLPLIACWLARLFRWRFDYLLTFFAGFCLIANGVYIGVGGPPGVGDAGDMLNYGCPLWMMLVFGITTATPGLYLWNGLGPRFGLGPSPDVVDSAAPWSVWGSFVIVAGSGILLHLWWTR